MNKPLQILSLGAGVQSSTILLMAINGELEKPNACIFSDTQWESRLVYEWLEFLESEVATANIPIYRVSIGNIRADAFATREERKRFAAMPLHVLNAKGGRGMLKRQCTSEYKIEPIKRKCRELMGYKKGQRIPVNSVEEWLGISLDEVSRMRDSQDRWITKRYPLIEKRMTRHDCLNWLEQRGYPKPPKSACLGCPFHDDWAWREMKINRPEEFADAVDFDRKVRRGAFMGTVECDAFVHRSLKPLDEVDFSTAEDRGQLNLFNNECSGLCGV